MKLFPRSLTVKEIEAWFALCDLHQPTGLADRAVYELAYGCGLRTGEILALDLEDLEIGESQIKVRGGKTGGRVLPVPGRCLNFVEQYLRDGRPQLPSSQSSQFALFLSNHGSRLSKQMVYRRIQNRYRPCLEFPEKVSMHALRHSFATHMLEGGANIRAVQELLGHQSLDSTQIYTRVEPKKLKEALGKAWPKRRLSSGNNGEI